MNTTAKKCKNCERQGHVSTLIGGLFCVKCDRVKCRCGQALERGTEKLCPACRDDVTLQTFMRRRGPK